jgi:hypothetical protein
VGPRAVLDAVVKRKIPSPRRESNPRTPIIIIIIITLTIIIIIPLDVVLLDKPLVT